MKALCWYDSRDIRVENAPDPIIQDPRDVIVKVTSTSICGSDLHIYNGFVMSPKKGDIVGHEFMGEVVEKVFVIGSYGRLGEMIPLGAFFIKGLTMRGCQAHVQRMWKDLLAMVMKGEIDPSFIVTHRKPLDQAVAGYRMVLEKQDGVMKTVLKP